MKTCQYIATSHKFSLLILIFSLAIRLGYVLYVDKGTVATKWSNNADARAYTNLADSLYSSGVYGYNEKRPSAFRPPLYPFFIAGLYLLFGKSYLTVRLIQAFIGALTCVIIFYITKNVFSEIEARIAGIAAAVYPFFIYFTGEMLTETLFIFLVSLSVLSILNLAKRFNNRNILLSGFCLGITSLCRFEMLAFLLFIILWLFIVIKEEKKTVFIVAIKIIGIVSTLVLLWMARNYIVFKQPLLATNSGYALYDGMFQDDYPRKEFLKIVKEELGYNLSEIENPKLIELEKSEIEYNNITLEKIRSFIKNNPEKYLRIVYRNFILFWGNLRYRTIGSQEKGGMIKFLGFFSYWILLLSGLLGIAFSLKNKNWEKPLLLVFFIIDSTIIHTLISASKRHRIATVDAYLIIFAAYAWYDLFKRYRQTMKKEQLHG